jgi:hypothetical protein
VSAEVPNADKRITEMEEALLARVKRLRKLGGDKYEDELDGVQDRVEETFSSLRDKLEDAERRAQRLDRNPGRGRQIHAELHGRARRLGQAYRR